MWRHLETLISLVCKPVAGCREQGVGCWLGRPPRALRVAAHMALVSGAPCPRDQREARGFWGPIEVPLWPGLRERVAGREREPHRDSEACVTGPGSVAPFVLWLWKLLPGQRFLQAESEQCRPRQGKLEGGRRSLEPARSDPGLKSLALSLWLWTGNHQDPCSGSRTGWAWTSGLC